MITAVRKTVYAKSADLRNAATGARFGATAQPNLRFGSKADICGANQMCAEDQKKRTRELNQLNYIGKGRSLSNDKPATTFSVIEP